MGGDHALMWVGKEKPLIHAASEKVLGIFQQSDDYFKKKIRNAGETAVDTYVFRYEGKILELANIAAEYAEKWATKSDDPTLRPFWEELNARKPKEGAAEQPKRDAIAKTPYSAKRLAEGHERLKKWDENNPGCTIEALFRALKAIARTEDNMPLSPNHGVTCDQFIVYCYQAATLKVHFKSVIPAEVVKCFRKGTAANTRDPNERMNQWAVRDAQAKQGEDANAKYWRDKSWWVEQGAFRKTKELAHDHGAISIMSKVLQHDRIHDFFSATMPKAMNRDVRALNLQLLLTLISGKESGFRRVGLLHRTDDDKFAIALNR
jgi:hypothetical protein